MALSAEEDRRNHPAISYQPFTLLSVLAWHVSLRSATASVPQVNLADLGHAAAGSWLATGVVRLVPQQLGYRGRVRFRVREVGRVERKISPVRQAPIGFRDLSVQSRL